MPFGTARGQGFNNPVSNVFQAANIVLTKKGLLVYSGAPAFGNLIYSAGAADGTFDRYGNALISGSVTYVASGTVTALAHRTLGINSYTAATAAGPYTFTGAGFTVTAAGAFTIFGTPASVAGQLTATGGTAAAPTLVTTDTWHTMTLTSGYTGTARYRLEADDTVFIESVGALAANGTIANGTSIWTPPAGYVPAQAQQMIDLGIGAVGAGSAAAAVSPLALITPTGLLMEGIAAQVATTVRFSGRYALD